eukprot:GHRR01002967.1.p1 GENE.GHRR01002967.1~~GHRR01002967.1.p1  ORF type:complete len:109 (+),score=14.00 GHRR01002967.1:1058-1384(+)
MCKPYLCHLTASAAVPSGAVLLNTIVVLHAVVAVVLQSCTFHVGRAIAALSGDCYSVVPVCSSVAVRLLDEHAQAAGCGQLLTAVCRAMHAVCMSACHLHPCSSLHSD